MIDPISPIALGAGLGSMMSNLLSKSASREERLRQAKVIIRGLIQEIDKAHPGYLFMTHKELSKKLELLGNEIIDDLGGKRQQEFGDACAAFVNSTDEEVRPVVTPGPLEGKRTPEAEAIEKENWFKPRKLLKDRLVAILNCL